MARKSRRSAPTLADVLFSQGFGTRYDCAQIVVAGAVQIDGVVRDDPDEEMNPEGLVFTYRGVKWPVCEHVLVALNKPVGYECSTKPSAHPSVMSLLPGQFRRRNVQPIGRLDADTTGLLLLTDDGALNHRLIHPKKHVEKVYEVTLKHPAADDICARLTQGVVLDDDPQPVAAKTAELVTPTHLRMTLLEGKYHQVKRMVAACGNRVESLHRSRVGAFVLPDSLAPGEWMWIDRESVLGSR